jgi:dethiobiotin synthetase
LEFESATMRGLFITGTDTGVGKTHVTAALTRHLRARGIPALALKPITCGDRGDAEIFRSANQETLALEEINPVFFSAPLAPYAAGSLEERPLDPAALLAHVRALAKRFPGPFLIEGIGGWAVPLTRRHRVADLAAELQLPVLVVAGAGLGTLNHTLLTVEDIHRRDLHCPGIVLNFHRQPDNHATRTNPTVLEDLTNLPVWRYHGADAPPPGWLVRVLQ